MHRIREAQRGNPLEDTKILSRILNYAGASFENLQNIRLVSRLWHEVSLDMWRSLATLKLLPDVMEQPEVGCSKMIMGAAALIKRQRGVPMSEYLANVVDPSDPYDLDTKPYSRVKLKGIDIESEMEFCGGNGVNNEGRSSPDASSIFLMGACGGVGVSSSSGGGAEGGFQEGYYSGGEDSDETEIINVLPRIWDLIGPFVTYLHCEECTFENTLKMGAFQKLIMERTPFLQTLVMTNTLVLPPTWEQNPHLIIRYDYNYHFITLHILGDFPMGLSNFLPYFPRIEELVVRNGTTETSRQKHFFSTVWVPFSNLRKINKESFRLRRLDVMGTDTFKISFNPTNQFRATRLPLQRLCVDVTPFLDFIGTSAAPAVACSSGASVKLRTTEDIIIPMLREHRETLQVFKVFRPPFSEPYPNFPFGLQLEHMEELHIWGNVTDSLNFLKYMPFLQVLYINSICFEKWEEMTDLLELEFPYEYQPFREDLVKNTGSFQRHFSIQGDYMRELHLELLLAPDSILLISEWMPNLTTLRTVLDGNSFRAVCTSPMRLKLQELRLLFGSDVDSVQITGVTMGIGRPRDPANITALRQLLRFQLDAYCGKSLMDDDAVYLGFYKLPGLNTLRICVSNRMSKVIEADAKKKIPFVHFIRNYGPGPHSGYECCQRVRFVREVARRIPSHHQQPEDKVFCF